MQSLSFSCEGAILVSFPVLAHGQRVPGEQGQHHPYMLIVGSEASQTPSLPQEEEDGLGQ